MVGFAALNPPYECAKKGGPHPKEAALLGGRLEGWPRAPPRKPPSFETRAQARAPQDEGRIFLTLYGATGKVGPARSLVAVDAFAALVALLRVDR